MYNTIILITTHLSTSLHLFLYISTSLHLHLNTIQTQARLAAEALLTREELAAQHTQWSEHVDPMTENVYWVCEYGIGNRGSGCSGLGIPLIGNRGSLSVQG